MISASQNSLPLSIVIVYILSLYESNNAIVAICIVSALQLATFLIKTYFVFLSLQVNKAQFLHLLNTVSASRSPILSLVSTIFGLSSMLGNVAVIHHCNHFFAFLYHRLYFKYFFHHGLCS